MAGFLFSKNGHNPHLMSIRKILSLWNPLILTVLFLTTCTRHSQNQVHADILAQSGPDTIQSLTGPFDIPELTILPSPESEKQITFSNSEKITGLDISPAGRIVAALVEGSGHKNLVRFWEIGQTSISDSCILPQGFNAMEIAWHPKASAVFVMGVQGTDYIITRFEKNKKEWIGKNIFSTRNALRRLIPCPRPFVTSFDYKNNKNFYNYRLFFGMDNGDKTFRIVSITERGSRFYQVVGPAATFTGADSTEDETGPSTMEANWALPVAFHPAGHQMIWEDKNNRFRTAMYSSRFWSQSKPMDQALQLKGSIIPTPNGLGLIHWQKDHPGIGLYLLATGREEKQATSCAFIFPPAPAPDGKGIVGVTVSEKRYTMKYVPVQVPLADVTNAWMFAGTGEETDHFQKHNGLFRPNKGDQLYSLYETENYACNGYDRNSPTRPYLVTTDIFWELFGAAYQGLFIVKERDEAIPNFWKFVNEADNFIQHSNKKSIWKPVFSALIDLYTSNRNDPEVKRMEKEQVCFTEILNEEYDYSDLKPRGHYTSSPEMEKYFRAFRYFTTIFKTNQDALRELKLWPEEILVFGENWINAYSGFIASSRSPLVWKKLRQEAPGYCQYPLPEPAVFPLSWGFDNEVLYSTVYHMHVSPDLQVRGPGGERMLPSGLDLAAVLGNGFAEKLLESDYKKYPPLRKVIENLKDNFKKFVDKSEFRDNIYNQWINALAVQWADSVKSANGLKDREIWQAKRLQTGLSTWATLRHATILVNERTAAECGEGGFEEILMRAPRGYVEPDPATFAAIAGLFESALQYVSKTTADKSDITESENPEKRSLYDGITERLKEAYREARLFQSMAGKELKGEMLDNDENEKILYIARIAEHLFLVFNSLSNPDYALSNPDPVSKIADVAGGSPSPYLMAAVGNPMEWDHIVPFYGRHQIVKGSVYSYFEFESNQLLNDQEWRQKVTKQDFLPWILPFLTKQDASAMAGTGY
jgi:hypothetical protein